jgi:serine O-acetyltransferase
MKANLPFYFWWFAHTLYKFKVPVLPFAIQQVLRILFGCYIPYRAKIGSNVHFGHLGLGIVIHPQSIIGSNVKVNHNVTIGGRNHTGFPIVGDNVSIGAGAQVLGGIHIGNHARIGANAVVVRDVPAYATVVGVPARILDKRKLVKRLKEASC